MARKPIRSMMSSRYYNPTVASKLRPLTKKKTVDPIVEDNNPIPQCPPGYKYNPVTKTCEQTESDRRQEMMRRENHLPGSTDTGRAIKIGDATANVRDYSPGGEYGGNYVIDEKMAKAIADEAKFNGQLNNLNLREGVVTMANGERKSIGDFIKDFAGGGGILGTLGKVLSGENITHNFGEAQDTRVVGTGGDESTNTVPTYLLGNEGEQIFVAPQESITGNSEPVSTNDAGDFIWNGYNFGQNIDAAVEAKNYFDQTGAVNEANPHMGEATFTGETTFEDTQTGGADSASNAGKNVIAAILGLATGGVTDFATIANQVNGELGSNVSAEEVATVVNENTDSQGNILDSVFSDLGIGNIFSGLGNIFNDGGTQPRGVSVTPNPNAGQGYYGFGQLFAPDRNERLGTFIDTPSGTGDQGFDAAWADHQARAGARPAVQRDDYNPGSISVDRNTGAVTTTHTTDSGQEYERTQNPGGGTTFSTPAEGGGYIVGNDGGYVMADRIMPMRSMMNKGGKLDKKISKIYKEGYTAPGQAYAIAKNMGYNVGGEVMPQDNSMMVKPPMLSTEEVAMKHPYDREGEQHDTIPANLTLDEFVVDADSAHMFGPILELINEWEPGDDDKEIRQMLSKKGEKLTIKREMADGTKMTMESPEGSTTDMSAMVDQMTEDDGTGYNRGGRVMMNTGGLNNFSNILSQFQNTSGITSNPAAQTSFDSRRSGINQAASQKLLGAGLNAGQQAIGRIADSRASRLAGAEVGAPAGETDLSGATQALGQGLQERGNIFKQRAADLGAVDKDEQAFMDAQAKAAAGGGADYGAATWIDPSNGDKYVRKEVNGQISFVNVVTGEVASQEVAQRLDKVGTEGSGRADVKAPEKLLSLNTAVTFLNTIADAHKDLLGGAAAVVNFINQKSASGVEFAKVAGAAKAAGGNEEVFRVLNAMLSDALIKSKDRAKLNSYYNWLNNVSRFEVEASKASGESRLTDEDAKRYLNAVVNPNATPESILTQLGRTKYDIMFEQRHTEEWQAYINDPSVAATDKTAEKFQANRWNAISQEMQGKRQEIIDSIAKSAPDLDFDLPLQVVKNATGDVSDTLPIVDDIYDIVKVTQGRNFWTGTDNDQDWYKITTKKVDGEIEAKKVIRVLNQDELDRLFKQHPDLAPQGYQTPEQKQMVTNSLNANQDAYEHEAYSQPEDNGGFGIGKFKWRRK